MRIRTYGSYHLPPKLKMSLTQITEGSTKLFVPDLARYHVPEHAPVFYNPAMARDRTNSVNILRAFFAGQKPGKVRVADVLCGTGARAVRYAHELDFSAWANDGQPSAVKLAGRNARLNRVKVRTSRCEANAFLAQHRHEFDAVDLDPFGSPAPFLANAISALKPKRSLLCLTATDTGTLSGAFPRACLNRYGVVAARTSFADELGVRNLLHAVWREAGVQDLCASPVAAFANRHYYRVFVKIEGRTPKHEQAGFITYCGACERRTTHSAFAQPQLRCECGKTRMLLGPTWTAPVTGECAVPFYDFQVIAARLKKPVPKKDVVIEKLGKSGYSAAPSQFSGSGVVTDAPYEKIVKCI